MKPDLSLHQGSRVTVMKVCVLQPSYEKSEMLKDYAVNDPPRDLSHLAPDWQFTHVFLHKSSVYPQLKRLKGKGFDIFVNLCEGHLEWDVPSIEVIHALEMLDLPFTGPTSRLYEPGKASIKTIAAFAGVDTPAHFIVRSVAAVEDALRRLRFPLFVKPSEGGDSFGVDDKSLCFDASSLYAKVADLLQVFDEALVEEYVAGREFSVLVAADAAHPGQPRAFRPVEFVFPEGEKFKTYDLKNTQFHPGLNRHVEDTALEERIMETARAVFEAYSGAGYCRLDLRKDGDGPLHVIDVNFTCSVFYKEGYYGTADYILERDGFGAANFLRLIVADGIARWQARRKPWRVAARDGVAMAEAVRDFSPGDLVWRGEETAHRIVTRRWVENHWSEAARARFDQSAVALGDEIFALWPDDPEQRAPLRHSCEPNLQLDGLNWRAARAIMAGDELTVDYAEGLAASGAVLSCNCGVPTCRKTFTAGAIPLDERERRRRFASVAAE